MSAVEVLAMFAIGFACTLPLGFLIREDFREHKRRRLVELQDREHLAHLNDEAQRGLAIVLAARDEVRAAHGDALAARDEARAIYDEHGLLVERSRRNNPTT